MTRNVILGCALFFSFTFMLLVLNFTKQVNASPLALSSDLVPLLVLHNQFENTNNPQTTHHFKHAHQFLMFKTLKRNFHFLSSLEELAPFDQDHDGIIDPSDPIYGRLYIGSYDEKKQSFHYQAITDTPIRAIKLIKDNQQQKLKFLDMDWQNL